jgi:hypothetical protein
VPFGLDTRVGTVQLATEVEARQDTAHDLTFTKTHFASSGRRGLMTILAAAILILPVAAQPAHAHDAMMRQWAFRCPEVANAAAPTGASGRAIPDTSA